MVRRGRLTLRNDLVYMSLIYIAVFAITPIYTPRYFYPVYVMWAAALCTPRPAIVDPASATHPANAPQAAPARALTQLTACSLRSRPARPVPAASWTPPTPTSRSTREGVCSHCHRYERVARERLIPLGERQPRLDALVARDQGGRARASPTTASSASAAASTAPTSPGWSRSSACGRSPCTSTTAGTPSSPSRTSRRRCKTLGIDLYTHVIDWEEFRDLQISFLKASTPDGEVPTDHAIFALLYQTRREARPAPRLHRRQRRHRGGPAGEVGLRLLRLALRHGRASPLRHVPAHDLSALLAAAARSTTCSCGASGSCRSSTTSTTTRRRPWKLLQDKLGWVYYGGKHYESIYTRFFQAYVLPRKFDIDKRKAHHSTLVCSGPDDARPGARS